MRRRLRGIPVIAFIALAAVIVSVSTYLLTRPPGLLGDSKKVVTAFAKGDALLTRPPGLLGDAKKVVTAFAKSDAAVIDKHIADRERQFNRLDSEKVRAIVEQVIAPNLASFKPNGSATSKISSGDGTEAYGMIPFKHASGLDYELYLHVMAGDTGGETLLTDMLIQSWSARYLCEAGYSTIGGIERSRARLKGLEADLPKLKQLGMNYLVYKSVDSAPTTLEDTLIKWKERVRSLEAEAASKPQ